MLAYIEPKFPLGPFENIKELAFCFQAVPSWNIGSIWVKMAASLSILIQIFLYDVNTYFDVNIAQRYKTFNVCFIININ